MSYVFCVIAVVPTEKNNGVSEASLNPPSESVDESIDKATLTSVFVEAFSYVISCNCRNDYNLKGK